MSRWPARTRSGQRPLPAWLRRSSICSLLRRKSGAGRMRAAGAATASVLLAARLQRHAVTEGAVLRAESRRTRGPLAPAGLGRRDLCLLLRLPLLAGLRRDALAECIRLVGVRPVELGEGLARMRRDEGRVALLATARRCRIQLVLRLRTRSLGDALAERVSIIRVLAVQRPERSNGHQRALGAARARRVRAVLPLGLRRGRRLRRDAVAEGVPAVLPGPVELVERLAAVSRSEGHVVLLRRARRVSARQVLLLDRRQARDAASKRRVSLRESGCADLRLQRGTCRVGVLRRVASRRG